VRGGARSPGEGWFNEEKKLKKIWEKSTKSAGEKRHESGETTCIYGLRHGEVWVTVGGRGGQKERSHGGL